jgi:hypothetical protein
LGSPSRTDRIAAHANLLLAFSADQAALPQTIGYGLVDSPALLPAWIYEKFHAWTDVASGVPEDLLSYAKILDKKYHAILTPWGWCLGRALLLGKLSQRV